MAVIRQWVSPHGQVVPLGKEEHLDFVRRRPELFGLNQKFIDKWSATSWKGEDEIFTAAYQPGWIRITNDGTNRWWMGWGLRLDRRSKDSLQAWAEQQLKDGIPRTASVTLGFDSGERLSKTMGEIAQDVLYQEGRFQALVDDVLSEGKNIGRAWITTTGEVVWTGGVEHFVHRQVHITDYEKRGVPITKEWGKVIADDPQRLSYGWAHITGSTWGRHAGYDMSALRWTKRIKDGLWDWAKDMVHTHGERSDTEVRIHENDTARDWTFTLQQLIDGAFL